MAITVSMLHRCRGAMHTQVRFFFPDLGLGGAGRALNSSVATYIPSHLPTYLPTYIHTYIHTICRYIDDVCLRRHDLHFWHHMHSTVESVAGESRYYDTQASVRLQPMPSGKLSVFLAS